MVEEVSSDTLDCESWGVLTITVHDTLVYIDRLFWR